VEFGYVQGDQAAQFFLNAYKLSKDGGEVLKEKS
jgi:hypothetical protein